MEHLINSINTLFENNYAQIGLDSVDKLSFEQQDPDNNIEFPSVSVYILKNSPENVTINAVYEKLLSIMQIDIYAKKSFYDGSASKLTGSKITQKIRDKIYSFLKNKNIPRHNYDTGIDEGNIYFEFQDDETFFLDGGVSAISMTYHVTWEKPIQ